MLYQFTCFVNCSYFQKVSSNKLQKFTNPTLFLQELQKLYALYILPS